MAIIPGSAKVLNQYENVNTTYGGSKAMKAQSKWYTMDDVIETIEAEGTGISGSGTVNYVPKFTGSEEVGDSQIFDDGTNVGIGTDTPVAKLHVDGSFNSTTNNAYLDVTTDTVGCAAYNAGFILEETAASFGWAPGGDLKGVRATGSDGVWFRNEANCKFGLEPVDNTLFAENGLIQNTDVPSNTLTPVKWIKIYNMDGPEGMFIPVYI
jgi:hypothetical protein